MEGNPTSPHQLTEREREILQRLASGLSDQKIADQLYLSLNTVKWYNHQIYSKLGVSNRTEAAICATALGLLDTTTQVTISSTSDTLPPNNLP